MNEAKNKACPFCGRQVNHHGFQGPPWDRGYFIKCDSCNARGPSTAHEDEEVANVRWNDRAGEREQEAAPNAGDIAGSFQRMVSLLADGIKAAEGAQVIVEAYYEDDYRDPSNSDQYCKLMDWLKDARRQVEQANAKKMTHSRD